MMRSHSARAGSVRWMLPPNTRSQGPSALTASRKASVTRTERLKLRRRAGSRLASMNASMSGWSQRSVAIMAPRRARRHDGAAHGVPHVHEADRPGGVRPDAGDARPFGRSVEKSWPMPPPCCIVSAASFTASKMAPRSSSTRPMTKQLKRVTARSLPAPARMRPAGRKPKSAIASWKRAAHDARLPPSSGTAAARHAPERVAERAVDRPPAGVAKAILAIPDLLRDRGEKAPAIA